MTAGHGGSGAETGSHDLSLFSNAVPPLQGFLSLWWQNISTEWVNKEQADKWQRSKEAACTIEFTPGGRCACACECAHMSVSNQFMNTWINTLVCHFIRQPGLDWCTEWSGSYVYVHICVLHVHICSGWIQCQLMSGKSLKHSCVSIVIWWYHCVPYSTVLFSFSFIGTFSYIQCNIQYI